MSAGLSMWTVYDHPRDFPAGFIARRFAVNAAGSVPTEDTLQAADIDVLRQHFEEAGLVCMGRADDDDPVIIETWF